MFRNVYTHSQVGLENGDMFVIGGYDHDDYDDTDISVAIWRMSAIDGSVTVVGQLQSVTLTIGISLLEIKLLRRKRWDRLSRWVLLFSFFLH